MSSYVHIALKYTIDEYDVQNTIAMIVKITFVGKVQGVTSG